MKSNLNNNNTNKYDRSNLSAKDKKLFDRFYNILDVDYVDEEEMAKALIYAVQHCKSFPKHNGALSSTLKTLSEHEVAIIPEEVIYEAYDELLNNVYKKELNNDSFNDLCSFVDEFCAGHDIYFQFKVAIGLFVRYYADSLIDRVIATKSEKITLKIFNSRGYAFESEMIAVFRSLCEKFQADYYYGIEAINLLSPILLAKVLEANGISDN